MSLARLRTAVRLSAIVSVFVLVAAGLPLYAQTVTIAPSKDNSLFESNASSSNGAGVELYSGESGVLSRRAVLAFDVAGNVPAGSDILSVSLELNVIQGGPFASASDVYTLHRLTQDWGEASSNGGPSNGNGGPAQTGDATWSERFFGQGQSWTTAGGDFVAGASASTATPLSGPVTWASTPQLAADVKDWLDNPGNNYGWILIGNEASVRSARRFDSREGTFVPQLTIEYMDPLVVTLASFTGETSRWGTELRWETISEVDNIGFRILRARGDEEPVVITPQLIPARGNELSGAVYKYRDDERQRPGVVTYYLEDIDAFGRTNRAGSPVTIEIVRPIGSRRP